MKNIKKLGIFTVILTALILQSGCYADKGNYDYSEISLLTIENIPEIRQVFTGDSLFIEPHIMPSILSAENLNWDNYTFEWRATRYNNSDVGLPRVGPLSRERILNVLIPPDTEEGDYLVFFRVMDRRTGISVTHRFTLRVTGGLTTGWLILNDINGASRLDMLPLNLDEEGNRRFHFVQNVLGMAPEHLRIPEERLQGRPIALKRFVCHLSPDLRAFYVLTETHSSRIRLRYFTWEARWGDIRTHFLPMQLAPPNFVASSIESSGDRHVMTGKDASGRRNAYYFNRMLGVLFWSHPVNTLTFGRTHFNVSPKHMGMLIFCTDSRSIFEIRENSSATGVGPATIDEGGGRTIHRPYQDIRTPGGAPLELVEMLNNGLRPSGIESFNKFIFRNPANDEHWILRTQSNFSQTHWQQMSSTDVWDENGTRGDITIDWSKVQLYASGGEFATSIYFAYGGKVFSYNVMENRSYLVLDKGTGHEITYLGFFSATGAGSTSDIFVASFDGTYGMLERYEISIRPHPFVIATHFIGDTEVPFRFGHETEFFNPQTGGTITGARFGRIVSIQYKPAS
jgi:hypothetical protein